MTKKEKVAYILTTLEKLYPNPPIPLKHKDSYTLLIAVLLSAQCTDKRVNQITPRLFALADNPKKMIRQSVQDIGQIIRPCGLSASKSKAIYRLSEILLERHKGEVPKDIRALEKLPGVGHKTASVVISQAFNTPAFAVDTHIHRLIWRWGLSNGKSVEQTQRDCKRLFPKNTWNKLHLQIIYYAREYSPARPYKLEKDIITQKIGRVSFLKQHQKFIAKKKKS